MDARAHELTWQIMLSQRNEKGQVLSHQDNKNIRFVVVVAANIAKILLPKLKESEAVISQVSESFLVELQGFAPAFQESIIVFARNVCREIDKAKCSTFKEQLEIAVVEASKLDSVVRAVASMVPEVPKNDCLVIDLESDFCEEVARRLDDDVCAIEDRVLTSGVRVYGAGV